jgi:hypothetical protein
LILGLAVGSLLGYGAQRFIAKRSITDLTKEAVQQSSAQNLAPVGAVD